MDDDWILVGLNAATVAVLLDAGLFKLARPSGLRRALAELAPGLITDSVVRGIAAVEVAVGVALLVPATRVPAAFVVGLLGAAFAALGVAGRARRSTEPCGCFGDGTRPLGAVNVLLGLALVAVAAIDLTGAAPASYARVAPVLAALLVLVLCLWMNRRLAWSLLNRSE
jgi:hypothetical protein